MEIEQEFLPPVEYLIMGMLGSRRRLGEEHWTFPSKLNSWLNSLARKGLLNWKAGIVPHSSVAWLTEAGLACCLSEEYLRTRKFESCGGQSGLAQVSERLREQYGDLVRVCPECGVEYVPTRQTKEYCGESCRQKMSNRVQKEPFTEDMTAQLYADALAGKIPGWQS